MLLQLSVQNVCQVLILENAFQSLFTDSLGESFNREDVQFRLTGYVVRLLRKVCLDSRPYVALTDVVDKLFQSGHPCLLHLGHLLILTIRLF
jgi:hypothetical protein